ncbi:MAG: cytochrome c oxidase assembly protein [Sulfurifustis sp.]
MSGTEKASVNRRTAAKAAVIAAGMFGFGYLLVPLYDLACQVAGLNGKTGRLEATAAQAESAPIARTVTVEFTGNATSGLPWEFRPLTKRIEVHPGETVTVSYYVRNAADEPITGQAIPSVAPSQAAPHFKKIECFCFSQQHLNAGEAREMPVRFTVLPDLAPEVQTITLSYAFFNVDKTSARKYGGDTATEQHAHHPAAGEHG